MEYDRVGNFRIKLLTIFNGMEYDYVENLKIKWNMIVLTVFIWMGYDRETRDDEVMRKIRTKFDGQGWIWNLK